MTDKPIEAEIKEFWQMCGFREVTVRARAFEVVRGRKHSWETCEQRWLRPNYEFEDKLYPSYHGVPFVDWELPPIDLNNLFKYAVPKLNLPDNELYSIGFTYNRPNGGVTCDIKREIDLTQGHGNTETLALFWAIYPVITGKEMKK